jgi:hypothetical protein
VVARDDKDAKYEPVLNAYAVDGFSVPLMVLRPAARDKRAGYQRVT